MAGPRLEKKRFVEGIALIPHTLNNTIIGEIEASIADNKLYFFNTQNDAVVQELFAATLSNKSLNAYSIIENIDSASTGTDVDLPAQTTSYTVLTDGALINIIGITSGNAGQYLILKNATGGPLVFNNESITAPANDRIITGTGSDITIADSDSVSFIYDSNASRWSLIGLFSATTGITTIGALDSQPSNPDGLSISSTTLSAQSADSTHPGMINTTVQSFSGDKTFNNNVTVTGSIIGTTTGNTTITPSIHGVIVSSASNILDVLVPDASTTKVLTSGGVGADPSWQPVPSAVFTAPTIQRFLSGSGTYTTPTSPSPLYIKVTIVGGGGGGAGGSAGAGNGSNGGNSTFGTSLLTSTGGIGASGTTPGAGGTATVNSPAIAIISLPGGAGNWGSANPAGVDVTIGGGGSNILSGGAPTGNGSQPPAIVNTGGGGSGGAGLGSGSHGAGGGASASIVANINSPSATYTYAVGALGALGGNGSNGASGQIIVEEFYQ